MSSKNLGNRNISDEMKSSYLSYAMSVIVSRALPDARDGLKPVHRRIIYAMYKGGYDWSKQFRKSARVVGDVIGKYHPHGDQAVYDALVRLAQDFSMNTKLLEGQGNFGSLDGDRAAAMRYTETKLAKISEFLVSDIDKNTVNFQNNYDDTETEPVVLPAQFPNLLVNGAGGIAVGMATNIPPHNLGEVIDGTLAYLDNNKISVSEIMKKIPGPDFPTGGIILGKNEIKNGYEKGRGSIKIRGEIDVEDGARDRKLIIIKSVPYQVNKTVLIEKIALLIRDKKLEGIADLRDESNKEGVRIVVELRKGVNHDIIINQLYKFSPLESSFGFNTLAINEKKPELLNLKKFIEIFVTFREKTIIKRTLFDLKKAKDRSHILIGLFIAIENIDEIISIIRKSKTPGDARSALLKKVWNFEKSKLDKNILQINELDLASKYQLSDHQVKAILELRLQKLTAIGYDEINNELSELYNLIIKLKKILNDKVELINLIKEELINIKNKFSTPRKTKIIDQVTSVEVEDVIQKEEVIVTVTNKGYIKRTPVTNIKAQKRGGRGKIGIVTREEDFVTQLFSVNTLTPVLFFSNKGIVYKIKTWKIPEGSNQSKGKSLHNLLPIDNQSYISSIMPLPENEDEWLKIDIVFITKLGKIRKNNLEDFKNIQSNGKIAMKLDKDDEIVSVKLLKGAQDVMINSHLGKSLRVSSKKIRLFKGRSSKGVKGMNLKNNDRVISLSILNPNIISSNKDEMKSKEEFILTITENGYGKRSSAYEFRETGRGGQGIINISTTERNGNVAASFPINADDDIMLVTNKGQMIRVKVSEIRIAGRNTQGVRIFKTSSDEKVVTAVRLADNNE
ncbi:MAG: DNA gyrase subunit A [Pelagibacteraceae bacterium]|nr:DNA gyrase subunit A [Pelagibacteraceae bacterium]MCI5079209.1 DNA gyrase subunit A [Pelagibacteraceae bacterium]